MGTPPVVWVIAALLLCEGPEVVNGFSVMQKREQFAELVAEAANCTRCPAMCGRAAVLSELNGPVDARVMFIGEAPGRKGADQTRIPFSGDQSGKNFEGFLAAASLKRSEIFITSAALCNPRGASGANRRPTTQELRNCSAFLQRTIELVNPEIIVTLGGVALEALKRLQDHPFTLRDDGAKVRQWNSRTLIPLYHPSPQVLITNRDANQQMRDYKVVKSAVRNAGASPAST